MDKPAPASDRPQGQRTPPDQFEQFVADVEPALRRALVAGYGPQLGRDAAVDALVWAWRNWGRIREFSNPGGYLYRVGQSAARRELRRQRRPDRSLRAGTQAGAEGLLFEPELPRALSELSVRQRTAVLLVHGYQFTLAEAAAAMGCSPSSARNHIQRGLRRLRRSLGASDEP